MTWGISLLQYNRDVTFNFVGILLFGYYFMVATTKCTPYIVI